MLKPLAPKTLERRYAQLGLPQSAVELVHKVLACFAHLYGVISVGEAWDLFREYEGLVIHKKDFIAVCEIVRREPGLPYAIYGLREVYTGETSEAPQDDLIIHNLLVGIGYGRFSRVYATAERRKNYVWYLPPKEELASFEEDPFYRSPAGRKMKRMIENLRSSGRSSENYGLPSQELRDLEGRSLAGRKLSDVVFFTPMEAWEIGYAKAQAKKDRLTKAYRIPASEKILNEIEKNILSGPLSSRTSPADEISRLFTMLTMQCGVELTDRQSSTLVQLYTDLSNSSHLWINAGWTPEDLFRKMPRGNVPVISFGSNMQRMFSSGEMNRAEVEEALRKQGFQVDGDE